MIKKINKIKNLGLVFSDYTWNDNLSDYQLPEFKRYNLIYGWTGSGKTTLSKLFSVIESGDVKNIPNLEYEVEDCENNKYKQGESFNKKIRVFNQDYIKNNLKIQEGRAKSITLILGDVNKEIVEQIEADEKGRYALPFYKIYLEEKFIENNEDNLVDDPFQRKRKVNFKQQMDDFYRTVEAVIAGDNNTQQEVLARGILRSKRQSYKTRKDRAYPRKSHRHVNKWQKL